MDKGLFVVFDGIDGSGTTTQALLLPKYIRKLKKHTDILLTHEPWKSYEIKESLKDEEDAYSGGLRMANLFVSDRYNHQNQQIVPFMKTDGVVISNRFSLSTIAYQSTQGVSLENLVRLHINNEIIIPDITFFLDVDYETAKKRIASRGEPLEKFERDESFIKKLIDSYRRFSDGELRNVLGKIIKIDGKESVEEVSSKINLHFYNLFYYLFE